MFNLDELKKQLLYNPETGGFHWLQTKGKAKKGCIAGYTDNKGYLRLMVNTKTFYCHRLAWFYVYGHFPKGQIDHINGNKSDNRLKNLRDVSPVTNMQNKSKALASNKSTGILGVTKMNDGKYLAQIRIGKNKVAIGKFGTANEAHQAYLEKKRKHHLGCTI